MNFITDDILEAAKAHAAHVFPRESCGLVAGGHYLPQENIAAGRDEFRIGRDLWIDVEDVHGPIQAVLHSHPHLDGRLPVPDYPSEADMRGQMATEVPWGIIVATAVGCFPEVVWFGDSCPVPPLSGPGRYFRHGVTDCYALIRDYYRVRLGITLLDFPREWEWWLEDGKDLYSEGFAKTGFQQIPTSLAKPGDVFLASIGTGAMRKQVTNHGGIYLGGNGCKILHHLSGMKPVDYERPAREEPGERWLHYATHFLRHKDMP